MPSIYEGNLSKTMVKQSNRNTLARKRAEKLKKDKEKYPLPFNIKEGMNSTIRQTSPELRAKDNQRTMVTNLIMDKYKMPYDEARAAYEDVLVPYQQKRDETAKRASFIGNKYNLDTLFTSKRESPGSESARSLTNMITPTEGGVVSENPYFKQGVGMEGFLSTTNAGRAVSDPNAPNRYRIAGDADLGRVDTPYNANTFNQQFKDIKAAFEEDPKLMAEIVGMSLAQDYVKTALPIAAGAFGGAVMSTNTGKAVNKSIMQFALDKAPVSDEAKYVVEKDWLAPATATSFIDPALTGLGLATGGVTGAFPVTSKLVKAGKAVAKSEKTAKAAGNVRDAGGVLAGTVLSAGGMGGMYNIGRAQRAADAAKAKTVSELLENIDTEVATQSALGLPDDAIAVAEMETELNKNKETYEKVRRVLDPEDSYNLDEFQKENPSGEFILPRSDLEKFLKENNLSYSDAAGAYKGPSGKDVTDNVTLRLAAHTTESKKNALARQGQAGNKRMQPILTAMDTLFAKSKMPTVARRTALKQVRDRQTKGMTKEQLDRIYAGKETAVFEKTSKGEWARVDHADHLIPIHKIKVRIQQLADLPGSTKDKKIHKDKALAYLEFVNSVDNFRGEHGMTNIRKGADMPDEYINKLLSSEPSRITQADMPTYLALQKAVEKLKTLVGEEEYANFLASI